MIYLLKHRGNRKSFLGGILNVNHSSFAYFDDSGDLIAITPVWSFWTNQRKLEIKKYDALPSLCILEEVEFPLFNMIEDYQLEEINRAFNKLKTSRKLVCFEIVKKIREIANIEGTGRYKVHILDPLSFFEKISKFFAIVCGIFAVFLANFYLVNFIQKTEITNNIILNESLRDLQKTVESKIPKTLKECGLIFDFDITIDK